MGVSLGGWVQACQPGVAPQGDFLMGRKSPKTHQREIPLETPCFYVCTGLGPKSALGLVGLVGWPDAPLGSFYSAGSSLSFHQDLKSGWSGLARPPSAGVRHR